MVGDKKLVRMVIKEMPFEAEVAMPSSSFGERQVSWKR
jgi:hypothetical protein